MDMSKRPPICPAQGDRRCFSRPPTPSRPTSRCRTTVPTDWT